MVRKSGKGNRKLSSRVVLDVCEAVERGLTQWSDIAAAAGVSAASLRGWRKLGEKGPKDDPDYMLAAAMVRQMQGARQKRRARYLAEMERTGGDDWRMWAKLLDRDEKARMFEGDEAVAGPGVTVDVAGGDGKSIAIVRVQPGLVEALTAGDGEDGDDGAADGDE